MTSTLCKNRSNYTERNKQPRHPLSLPNPSKTAPPLAPHQHPCHMNALLALRPCKAFGRSTSGIHARPRKRVRFCCSVKPSQLWWGLFLVRTINEIFRTIPHAFRRARVCVCLYGFASELSHPLFVGRGARPSRSTVVVDFLSVFNLLSIED